MDVQSALSTFQQELRGDLADKLAILQRNLKAQPVAIEDLPPEAPRPLCRENWEISPLCVAR